MKKTALSLAILASVSSPISQAKENVSDLGSLDIINNSDSAEATKAAPLYTSYDAIDSGTSVISEQSVKNSAGGGTDTIELLISNPYVQVSNEKESADKEDIQSLRPSNFSISGGNYYDNNIQIDGVSATSVHDVTGKGSNEWDHVDGQTSQTLYVDPSLIGEVEILDSNISAKYGDFTGGVVNYKIRKPKKEFAVNFSAGFQNDAMVEYKIAPEDEADELEPPADFSKYRSSLSFDLPLTNKLFLLTAYTRAESEVAYVDDVNYGGKSHKNGDRSEQFLVSGAYEYSEDLTLEGQVLYSPYTSDRDKEDRIKDQQRFNSSGLQVYVAANGRYQQSNWQSKLSYSYNDSSKDAQQNTLIQWKGDSVDWCSENNCYEGNAGDFEQTQTDFAWTAEATTALNFDWVDYAQLRYGFELKHTIAEQRRPKDVYSYSSAKKISEGNIWDCSGTVGCNDSSAVSRYASYGAYDAQVAINNQALWAEYQQLLGDVDMRFGMRYSHDDFLNNYNLAPRVTVAWEFLDETYLTLGANRYYANNMVGYALKSEQPGFTLYKRAYDTSTGVTDDWAQSGQGDVLDYRNAALDTSYSDELSAAVTIATSFDGNLRLKTVYRQNRDQFAKEKLKSDSKKIYYQLSNEGESDYLGYSIEWSGGYRNHHFTANVTWSETTTSSKGDYFSEDCSDDPEYFYNGSVVSECEKQKISGRGNFAAPIKAYIGWSSEWFSQSLLTNVAVNYRGGYEDFKGTDEDYTDANDEKYEIYAVVDQPSYTSVDLNAQYRFLKRGKHNASIDFRVSNLFNQLPYTSSTYQMGRAYWIGVNYSM